jgi:hypothetical protein
VKWNFAAFIIGPPEYGKTSILRKLIRRHLAELPSGIVLVHDPVAQFGRDGAVFFKDAAAYRAAAVAAADEKNPPLPRAASIGGSAEELTKLALQMGERAGNTQDHVRVPILLAFDEGSLREGSGATWMGKDDNELLATRRHRGVGIVINLQDGSQLTERFFRMSTDVYLMAQTTEHCQRLDKALMLEKGTLEAAGVPKLEMHRYLHVRLRVGVVSEAL